MCGICAQTSDPADLTVRAMNDAEIVHGGPDDHRYHLDLATGVALGARRPSVIDLADGLQAMTNERKRNSADLPWPLFALGCWFDGDAGAR